MSRTRSSAVVAVALAMLASGAALAQPAAPAAAGPATPLSGLTVAVPRTPPAVVSTVPAAGAAVDPGVIVLKVVFDQAMDAAKWRYAKAATGEYPDCLAKPRLLADARTFVLLCTARSGRDYAVRLNEDEGSGFASVGGRVAAPFELKFSTVKGRLVASLADAMKVSGLRDDEGPVLSAEASAR